MAASLLQNELNKAKKVPENEDFLTIFASHIV